MRIEGITHFIIQELVPELIFKRFGAKSIWFLDFRILQAADLFRELVNRPVKINDWHRNNGFYSESGYRLLHTSTGGSLSQHKFGRALDLKVAGMTSDEMAKVIFDHWPEFKALGLTTIENPEHTKGKFQDWLHIDCRQTNQTDLLIVNP